MTSKLADIIFGDSKKGRLVSGGVFLGSGDAAHRNLLQERVAETGSLQRARESIKKTHPDLFSTAAFRFETEPKAPSPPGGIRKLLGMGAKGYKGELVAHKKALVSYRERTAKPRIFLSVGPTASRAQSEFYRDVERGEYDPNHMVTLRKKASISRETMAAFSDELQQIKLAAKLRHGDDIEGDGPGPKSLGRTMASNALGLAAGTAAGYGAGKLIETVAKKRGVPMGAVWPKVMKGATTAMGMAYPVWKMTEQGTMSGRKRKK